MIVLCRNHDKQGMVCMIQSRDTINLGSVNFMVHNRLDSTQEKVEIETYKDLNF